MRYFALALAVLALTVIGCGGSDKPEVPVPADTTAMIQPTESVPAAAELESPAKTPAETPAEVKPAAEKDLPKLWDFSAEWCPPCKQLKPIIAQLETECAGKVEIRTIDTDKDKELAREFGVQAIPTLVYLDASGKELDRSVGLVEKSAIVDKFKTLKFIQ